MAISDDFLRSKYVLAISLVCDVDAQKIIGCRGEVRDDIQVGPGWHLSAKGVDL
jgi:hypothetical protein